MHRICILNLSVWPLLQKYDFVEYTQKVNISEIGSVKKQRLL